jgi:hypothetical protein
VQSAGADSHASLLTFEADTALLTIRKEQMERLNQTTATGFESRMHKYLMKTYPDVLTRTPAHDVQKSIRVGIRRAAAYGMIAEYDVARFIDLMYRLSQDFDSNPKTSWIRTVLDDPDIHPHAKMDLIHEKA